MGRRAWQKIAQWRFRFTGHASPAALSAWVIGLERLLVDTKADVFFAHNPETLLTASRAARRLGASLMFDSMEFHSDMGDAQTDFDRSLIRAIESRWLPNCALVFAASDQIADELVKAYGISRPTALYNVPPLEETEPPAAREGFQLYWRNSVVGLGQRGLEEALLALQQLPEDITLHLQGRPAWDGGQELNRRINDLGLASRVTLHGPYAPNDAIKEASKHTVGLCLERRGPRNHDLTVSNKMFDYHMARLVTVASDLPGLRAVLERSKGGLTFEPGSADDLARVIMTLYSDRKLVRHLSGNARAFALAEGNSQSEMKKLREAFLDVYGPRLEGGRAVRGPEPTPK